MDTPALSDNKDSGRKLAFYTGLGKWVAASRYGGGGIIRLRRRSLQATESVDRGDAGIFLVNESIQVGQVLENVGPGVLAAGDVE